MAGEIADDHEGYMYDELDEMRSDPDRYQPWYSNGAATGRHYRRPAARPDTDGFTNEETT